MSKWQLEFRVQWKFSRNQKYHCCHFETLRFLVTHFAFSANYEEQDVDLADSWTVHFFVASQRWLWCLAFCFHLLFSAVLTLLYTEGWFGFKIEQRHMHFDDIWCSYQRCKGINSGLPIHHWCLTAGCRPSIIKFRELQNCTCNVFWASHDMLRAIPILACDYIIGCYPIDLYVHPVLW